MSGLLRRIRRPGAAEEPRTEPIEVSEPAHGSAPSADGARAPAVGRPLPAGVAPEDLERRRAAGRRGKLRRRARFLRRARELALRDLGGLVYEARRRRQDTGPLVEEKVRRLAALDEELHGLEAELGAPRGESVLREPGVGGTCGRCGELHASDAHFCSGCGLDLTTSARLTGEETPDAPATPAEPAPESAVPEPADPAEPARQDQPAARAANGRAATRPTPEATPDTTDRPA